MRKQSAVVIVIGYGIMVGYLSLQQGGHSAIGSYDKLAHLMTYAVFALLAYQLRLSNRAYLSLCIGIIVYSAMLEYGQSHVPGRMMSGLDLVANTVGVVIGMLLSLKLLSGLGKRR